MDGGCFCQQQQLCLMLVAPFYACFKFLQGYNIEVEVILCRWTKPGWPLPPSHWRLWGWVGSCVRQLAQLKGWLAACKLCSPRAQSGVTAVQIWIELAAMNLNLKTLIENQQSCCTVFTPSLESPLHWYHVYDKFAQVVLYLKTCFKY